MNFILQTDSYKLTHHSMYPLGTTRVYSYLEARHGGDYPATVWFGLQYYLKRYLEGVRVTRADIDEAEALCASHFAQKQFNRAGWERIVNVHGGRIPVRIRALPEGLLAPCGNALMTIENTDPQLPWITNAIESILLKVWYPTTVATVSHAVRTDLHKAVEFTGGEPAAVEYMLHDFGYRGCSSEESAAIGGAAHLLSFRGTDTLPAMMFLREHYGASMDGLAHSVAASEHSVMTSNGCKGEIDLACHIIATHQNQIVSIVADSYDYYRFVDAMIDRADIVKRYGVKLVIRPDSVTSKHATPQALVRWTLERIASRLGYTETKRGYKVVPYGVLWGDGIDPNGINLIVKEAVAAGFAAHNLVFGMGGGLLQKVNRDTCRFALKCSAQERDGKWIDIQKRPLDASKQSKAGRLKVVIGGNIETVREGETGHDLMVPVFEDGVVLHQWRFADIRRI